MGCASFVGRSIVASLVGVLCWAGGGCSSYSAPSLKVVQGTTAERSADAVVLNFLIEGENPNDVALPLKDVRYDLYVGGRKIFSGYRSPEATLRRFGTRQLILPVAVPVAQAGDLAGNASYRLEGVLEYTTPGAWAELLFENDLRRPSVTFRGEGQLDQPAGG